MCSRMNGWMRVFLGQGTEALDDFRRATSVVLLTARSYRNCSASVRFLRTAFLPGPGARVDSHPPRRRLSRADRLDLWQPLCNATHRDSKYDES
jgi:hypothetical protein